MGPREWCHPLLVGDALGCRQPRLVIAEQVPDGLVVRGFVGLEVEVQDHDRPRVLAVVAQCRLGNRADSIEEMGLERRLGAIRLRVVRHHDPSAPGGGIDEPGDVLFNGDVRRPHGERALGPIAPLALFGIAVVRV